MLGRSALLLAMFGSLVAPVTIAEEADAIAPRAVIGMRYGSVTWLAWLPGETPADSFKIYGVRQGVPTFLGETGGENRSAEAPPGYDSYAVSGVRASVESNAKTALMGILPCVTIIPQEPPNLPGIAIDDCDDKQHTQGGVELP